MKNGKFSTNAKAIELWKLMSEKERTKLWCPFLCKSGKGCKNTNDTCSWVHPGHLEKTNAWKDQGPRGGGVYTT